MKKLTDKDEQKITKYNITKTFNLNKLINLFKK